MGAGWFFRPHAFQLALYPPLLEPLAAFAGFLEHGRRRGAVTRLAFRGRGRCGDHFGGGWDRGFARKRTIDAVGHSAGVRGDDSEMVGRSRRKPADGGLEWPRAAGMTDALGSGGRPV